VSHWHPFVSFVWARTQAIATTSIAATAHTVVVRNTPSKNHTDGDAAESEHREENAEGQRTKLSFVYGEKREV
jgi:hypothetical protein